MMKEAIGVIWERSGSLPGHRMFLSIFHWLHGLTILKEAQPMHALSSCFMFLFISSPPVPHICVSKSG